MKISGNRYADDEDSATDNGFNGDDGSDLISPIDQLEMSLDGWSSSPSSDRSGPDELHLYRLVITRPLIHRLLPFFRHNEQDDHIHDSAGTTSNTPVLRFNRVRFDCCGFCLEADTAMAENHDDVSTPDGETMPYNNDDVCTPDDMCSFLSAIARLRDTVTISHSHGILAGLLSFPEIDHLEMQHLNLFQQTRFQESEYARLGALIQRSVQTTHVTLEMFYANAPQEFYDCLANSIHIQELGFRWTRELHLPWYSRKTASILMSKLIIGGDGNGAVERLLRNPQSQLVRLILNANLKDHHLIAIAQLLPNSKVECFSFEDSEISLQGLLEFFRQIPKMHSLRAFCFGDCSWMESPVDVREECSAALLDGVMKNPSITDVGGMISYPPHPLLIHYQSLNCGGRKILASYQPHNQGDEQPASLIPDELWPHILARAGRRELYKIPELCRKHNGAANAIFFFLQNCPKILSCYNQK